MRFPASTATLTSLVALLLLTTATDGDDAMFPFVVSYDATLNAANISSWLERPAGKRGFIRTREGRLVNDAGPVRFLGTNLCFDACFPTHDQADRLARRLARFGINVVRMHHMDAHSIWGTSPDHLTLDPVRLERLDYLIHRLKQEGVYTNLNLHVSRSLGPKEGFPDPERRPNYDKGLDNFEPRMIELQERYARDLLTHVNPYLGVSYAHERAIAFVEINNENALFHEWAADGLDDLPEPYATTFRRQWDAWLRKKYVTTAALRKAWDIGQKPLGEELLTNGDFARPLTQGWNLEREDDDQAAWSVAPSGPKGQPSLRLEVRRPGSVSWKPQFAHAGVAVTLGEPYTLSFSIRADRPRSLLVNCMMAHDPWSGLGLAAPVEASADWQTVQLTFLADDSDANARITFTNLQPGVYELAAVSLRSGGVTGLAPDERLEDDRVPVMAHARRNRTAAARNDFMDFLYDTEREYWSGMHRFLKDELKVQSLVSGTQLSWSPVHVQAEMDFIDAHAYWQHPDFPGRPWDPRNWYVNNVAMVNSPGGALNELAGRRVLGRPFTVSEYNHPTPNDYAAEGLPMLAALASFQAWDAIYSFAWSHEDRFEPDRLTGFFDIQAEPTRLVHLPACAAMFVRGDVAPSQTTIRIPLSTSAERRQLHETATPWSLTADRLVAEKNVALVQGIGLEIATKPGKGETPLPRDWGNEKEFVSDNGEQRWDVSQAGKGFFTVDAPRTKVFTGFVGGRTFQLGEVTLDIGKTQLDWATVSLTCLDGAGFNRPGRILVAATARRRNSAWQLESLGEDRVTLRDRWDAGPILCEGVPATIALPVPASRVACYALDAAGNRATRTRHEDQDGKAHLILGPEHKTLWYEVIISPQ